MPKPLLKQLTRGLAARVMRSWAEWMSLSPPFSVTAGVVDSSPSTIDKVSGFFPGEKYELKGTWAVGSNEWLLDRMAPLEGLLGQFRLGSSACSISVSRTTIDLTVWEGPAPFRSPLRLLGMEIPKDIYWHEIEEGIRVMLQEPRAHLQIRINSPNRRDRLLQDLFSQIDQIEELTYCHVFGSVAALENFESTVLFSVDRGGFARGLNGAMTGPTTENLDALVEALDVLESDPEMSGFIKLGTRVEGIAPKPMEVFLVWTKKKGKLADIELDSLDRLPPHWKTACVNEIRRIEQRLLGRAESDAALGKDG